MPDQACRFCGDVDCTEKCGLSAWARQRLAKMEHALAERQGIVLNLLGLLMDFTGWQALLDEEGYETDAKGSDYFDCVKEHEEISLALEEAGVTGAEIEAVARSTEARRLQRVIDGLKAKQRDVKMELDRAKEALRDA